MSFTPSANSRSSIPSRCSQASVDCWHSACSAGVSRAGSSLLKQSTLSMLYNNVICTNPSSRSTLFASVLLACDQIKQSCQQVAQDSKYESRIRGRCQINQTDNSFARRNSGAIFFSGAQVIIIFLPVLRRYRCIVQILQLCTCDTRAGSALFVELHWWVLLSRWLASCIQNNLPLAACETS